MKQTAFTLIELLVVIVIIGILATITTATFSNSIEKARNAKMLVELEALYDELERHAIVNQDDPNVLFYGSFSGWSNVSLSLVPSAVMPIWRDAGLTNENSLNQLLKPYTKPGSLIHVFGSSGNSNTSSVDNDFAIIGWGNGFGTFDASKEGVIIVGTPRMRDAIEANLANITEVNFQSAGYITLSQRLFRYLCSPLSVYTILIQGTGTSSYAAMGNEDRGWIYSQGGFTNNPVCPY